MTVRDGLLALLDVGPRHGYQLKTEFEAATGGVWSLNVGQVYSTLDRLQRDGLVVVRGGAEEGDQKQYSLTAEGREALGAWWEAVPADNPPPRDELQLKVLMAIERNRDHALDVITRQRTALTRLLQERRRTGRANQRPARSSRRPAEAGGNGHDDLAAELVADALVVRAEADLRWLDLCEARLLHRQPGNQSDRK
jgi:DNA-binding PadR family transcriptional regulator